MNSLLAENTIKKWWEVSYLEKRLVHKFDLYGLIMAMTVINPLFYALAEKLTLAYAETQLTAIVVSGMAFATAFGFIWLGCHLVVGIIRLYYDFNTYESNKVSFNGQCFKEAKVEFNFLKVKEFLHLDPKTLKPLSKFPALSEGSNKKAKLYQIAETNEFFISDFIFADGYLFRMEVIVSGSFLMNVFIGMIAGGFSWSLIGVQLAVVIVVIGLFELGAYLYRKWNRENNLFKAGGMNESHIDKWCKYQFIAEHTKNDCYLNEHGDYWAQLSLVIGEGKGVVRAVDLEDLGKENIAINLRYLVEITYKTMGMLNENRVGMDSDLNQRGVHVDLLESISKKYIPACITQISKNLDRKSATSNLIVKNEVETNLKSILNAYSSLELSIAEQIERVKEVRDYYDSNRKALTLITVKDEIAKTERLVSGDSKLEISLKTRFISDKLNNELIPSIQEMMTGASAEDIKKLEVKIEQIRQVVRDKELMEKPVKTREVSILVDDKQDKTRVKSEIDSYIAYLDSYLDGLKNNW